MQQVRFISGRAIYETGFQPFASTDETVTWGDAPGWYDGAPLALENGTARNLGECGTSLE